MSNISNITLIIAKRRAQLLFIKELELRGIFRLLLSGSYGFAITFHIIGFIALYYHKKRTNQNIILFFLSVVEIGLSITGLILVQNFHLKYLSTTTLTIINYIHEVLVFEIAFTMSILTLDRLVCAVDPLKYGSRMTKARLLIYFIISWLIASVLVLLKIAFSSSYKKGLVLFMITLCVVYVLLALVTYLLILITIKKSRNRVKSESTSTSKSLKKQYLIPILIISTFLIFYVIPFGIARTTPENTKGIIYLQQLIRRKICQVCQIIGMSLDPIIYVFLSKHYRRALKGRLVCTSNEVLGRSDQAATSSSTKSTPADTKLRSGKEKQRK